VKRLNKIGLKDAYVRQAHVKELVHCLLGLPLLPPADMGQALQDIRITIDSDDEFSQQLQQLVGDVKRQWLDRSSVGPERLSVRDSRSRTNNILESYHSTLRRRIQVSHPNMFAFLTHLQNTTVDNMADMRRVQNGITIRRPKKKRNIQNDARIKACIERYDAGAYSTHQFLRAISHSLGAHTTAFDVVLDDSDADDDDQQQQPQPQQQPPTQQDDSTGSSTSQVNDTQSADTCEVCLIAARSGVALVPCGHSRFCTSCAETVAAMDSGCPICRSPITMVLRVFS